MDYGFGNAAITGITGGIIWGLISNVCCIIHKYADNIKDVINIAVKPHYTEQVFEYKINIVFYVRINYSFTAPIFTPFTKYFCKNGYKIMKGRIAAIIPALNRVVCETA